MGLGLLTSVRRAVPAVACGAALGLAEVLVTAQTRGRLFLSVREFVRFAGLSVATAMSLCLIAVCACTLVARLLWRLIPAARFASGVALLSGAVSAPILAWLLWTLTQGRRVRDLPSRPLAVGVAAAVGAALVAVFAVVVYRMGRSGPRVRGVGFWVLLLSAAGTIVADALVLHRLYPTFHWALGSVSVVFAAAAASLWPWPVRASGLSRTVAGIGVGLGVLAPFALRGALQAPNLSYAIEEGAPLTGKLLGVIHVPVRPPAAVTQSVATGAPGPLNPPQPALQLQGSDVLLITIDALRADRLRAYGAHRDTTPNLDRLAEQSAVFTRAYTQTPHTSYALGSLFTGKYLRPVLSLPGAPTDHTTLAQLVRRYGYRTAAFYPPAVFFVDGDRFKTLKADHFGFEYVKEMFAPAQDRIAQLQTYLDRVDPGHPLLVWVHLFEPHEPYEPKPEFARGDEPEQRYDGEVAAADAAVGKLIQVFRARSPDATVIVTADHGEEFGDHGGYHHGTTLFDEQVRVPLVWSSPGRVPAHRIRAAVQLIDVTRTLLTALAVPRDARMRGQDLSGLLVGAKDDRSLRAFASIGELRMWSDGEHKLICEASQAVCRLYDLSVDPNETRDASAQMPELSQQLRGELSQLVASIPSVEAIALHGEDGWPKALARARLGDASVGDELLPLLADARPAVRAETARAIARLRLSDGLRTLTTLARSDMDAGVRDEAAVAALTLGHSALQDHVRQVLERARAEGRPGLNLARRAAFALVRFGDPVAATQLTELAADLSAGEQARARALAALAAAGARQQVRQLVPLLRDVRVRAKVAVALGRLGGSAAESALAAALSKERYAEARSAEAEALVRLRADRAKPLLLRMLGTQTGVPGGLELWAELPGPREGRRGFLADLRTEHGRALRGDWACQTQRDGAQTGGCHPGESSTFTFAHRQVPGGELRCVLVVWCDAMAGWLRLASHEYPLRRGKNELALFAPAVQGRQHWRVTASEGVRVQLVGLVGRQADIAPPPPEPYEPDGSSDGSSGSDGSSDGSDEAAIESDVSAATRATSPLR